MKNMYANTVSTSDSCTDVNWKTNDGVTYASFQVSLEEKQVCESDYTDFISLYGL